LSESRDHALDEIISSLNSIREQLDEGLEASTTKGTPDSKEPRKPNEDEGSFALEEYLATRLQQIGEVAPERKEFEGLRTGNGWDANQVIEQVFRIDPIPIKRAVEIACSTNRSSKERMLNFLRRSGEDVKVVGTPIVEFVPVWKVRGFHECYYLRTNSYRVNVRDDVVGVEVEGRSRDLILERKQRHFIPAAVVHRFQRLGSFLLGDSKYFVISNATELAAKRSQSELAITGAGRTLDLDQYSNLTAWRSKRIFDSTELKVRGARVQVREPAVSKEDVLKKFREEVIHMPERFKQILSSRLHVTEMRRVYIPLIRISVQKGLVPREIVVNGTSGEPADSELLELLE